MNAKVVLQQKFPYLSPGSESEKGPQAQQNRRGAYQGCLRGRSRFPIRNACCRPTYRPEDCHKSSACRHCFHQRRATIRRRPKSPRGDRTKTRHACASSGAARSPSLFRWASGMHPDTYIIDVNGNPVAEPNLEARTRMVVMPPISAKIYAETWQGRGQQRNRRRITALPYSRGRPLAHHRKDNPRARGPAEKQSGDK